MNIILNGNPETVTDGMTIAALLQDKGYGDKLVAVAVNGAFTPKSTREEQTLSDGDTVEIVAPMQGG